MRKVTQEEKEKFIKAHYYTCDKCGYNNEKSRFMQYGTCLRCGSKLDEKVYFMIEMMKRIKNNERKRG